MLQIYVCEFVRNYPRCAANVSVAPAYIGLGHMVRCYTVTRPLGLGYSLYSWVTNQIAIFSGHKITRYNISATGSLGLGDGN